MPFRCWLAVNDALGSRGVSETLAASSYTIRQVLAEWIACARDLPVLQAVDLLARGLLYRYLSAEQGHTVVGLRCNATPRPPQGCTHRCWACWQCQKFKPAVGVVMVCLLQTVVY